MSLTVTHVTHASNHVTRVTWLVRRILCHVTHASNHVTWLTRFVRRSMWHVTRHSCHGWHEWHVAYFDAWVSATGGVERAKRNWQKTKSLFSESWDFSRFELESLALIRFSEFWVGISGDNPSFRIYKRQKTHAVLCLADVVSPFLYTRGWCHSRDSCHPILPCPSSLSQNVCREWHESHEGHD